MTYLVHTRCNGCGARLTRTSDQPALPDRCASCAEKKVGRATRVRKAARPKS